MFKITSLARDDKMLLGISVVTAVSGLIMRSCHDAGAGFLLPMCTSAGTEVSIISASSGHCAGCYVAAFGLLSAFGVTVRRAVMAKAPR